MNRILKRPMFRMGGSSGTGITSGLDRPTYSKGGGADRMMSDADKEFKAYNLMRDAMDREKFLKRRQEEMKMDKRRIEEKRKGVAVAEGGRIGYQQGSMPNFQMGGLPGFLTGFGLNLLATPPQGNIFQTAATAARDPFNQLQASQAALMKTASDRAFARELAKEEREFEEGQLEKRLDVERAKIDKMGGGDTIKRVQAIADTKYEGDTIKAQREVDFPNAVYPNLVSQYGNKQVATTVIDSTNLQKQKDIDKFVDLNPFLASKFVYDVATGKTMMFVKDKLSGRFKLIPADSADIDTTGEDMPPPKKGPDFTYFSPEQKKKIEELGSEFSDEFYQGG